MIKCCRGTQTDVSFTGVEYSNNTRLSNDYTGAVTV